MRNAKKVAGQMFSEVPRPWGLAGAMTIVMWLLLVVAFVTDAVPTRSSDEWLYDVEARRAGWAQQLSAREVAKATKVSARQVARPLRAAVATTPHAEAPCN